MIKDIQQIKPSGRILSLREKTMAAERYLSIEQAKIITSVYRQNEDNPVVLKRAKALSGSLLEMTVAIDPDELIVGNRTPGIRAGVVFPEAGISWLSKELGKLPFRPQDPFKVKQQDISYFKEEIEPYWNGKTLEDDIYKRYGDEIGAIEKAVKINQKDHAQGHICPDVKTWLEKGPAGLLKKVKILLDEEIDESKIIFYKSACIALSAACTFINRYGSLATDMANTEKNRQKKENLLLVANTCNHLAIKPPATFRQAVQSVWFLFVILQMESNASSFSPGRIDQYLNSYLESDLTNDKIDLNHAVELLDALFIKFNQIVYMRNEHSAKYFAGFPIGFNVTIGGQKKDGSDATNLLSYLALKAHDHTRLPQPNLTARIHKNSPSLFLDECSRTIGLGTGMPQVANDGSIIPSLLSAGISKEDANDYVLVGCVELSTQGNFLGWSDAAMFNMVKVLELTLNNGKCTNSGEQIGPATGYLFDFATYSDFENAFAKQLNHFIDKMIKACEAVEKCHQEHLPSPFLSSVINECLAKGKDVTAGGALYNYSGIQAIQPANIADSLAVLKKAVFEDKDIDKVLLAKALLDNFRDNETLRQFCINRIPKYGNDIEWVDKLGAKWISYFADKLKEYSNLRGGPYQMGLYTVSAHVPMGYNVGATPDGRLSQTPLADGGLSPVYGRDKNGPTATLNSVSHIPSLKASNGTLLNMKFMPALFKKESDRQKFTSLLKSFSRLPVHHVQFNVVSPDELREAQSNPDSYRGLTIRVAGYTAYFTELARDLQDEIIERTTHGYDD
jgi:pyruvate formate-lyase/glycerol dehydratase family glycyl radical enzyme